ncbi:MAG TPA: hypothetical protein VGB64_12820 [Actinomycetota bacterium]
MSKRFGVISVITLGVTFGLLAMAFVGSGKGPAADAASAIQTCLNMTFPANTSISTHLDKTNQTLELSWFDETTAADKSVMIRYVDPTCQANAQTKAKIDHALDVDLEWMTETCQSLDRISSGAEPAPTRNGVTLNVLAVPAFMTANCTADMIQTK